jgi:alkylated DNA repair dioxygenase AlkB
MPKKLKPATNPEPPQIRSASLSVSNLTNRFPSNISWEPMGKDPAIERIDVAPPAEATSRASAVRSALTEVPPTPLLPAPRDIPFSLADLRYEPNFITIAEEDEILAFIQTQSHWTALGKKQRLSYGWHYSLGTGELSRGKPIPSTFHALALRLNHAGMMPELAEQVVVQKYLPGQGIGRHIDLQPKTEPEFRPGFGPVVVSLSLLSPCVMRFSHTELGRGPDIVLEPRSALAISGAARRNWFHEIVGRTVRELRISITFRTVVLAP